MCKRVKQSSNIITWALFYLFFYSESYSQNSILNKKNIEIQTNSLASSYMYNISDSLKYLIQILDSIRNSDQKYRVEMLNLTSSKEQAIESLKEYKNKSKYQKINDSLNLILISSILDKYGWLGTKDIGYFGMQTIFMVLQHADLATQEKYLPVIRTAFQHKKLSAFYLALFEDRISIKKNKYQLYGTQFFYAKELGRYFFFPIHNPAFVKQMRENIGLEDFVYDDYLKTFNISWDIAKYYSDSLLLSRKNIQYFSQNE